MAWRERIAKATETFLPGERWERWTFGALMLVAAVLRCWDLPNLPFSHDELSTLLRFFPTLSETIREGVMIGDVHPPGVHVFAWCWTRLFGLSAPAVKLPFIAMGLLALFHWYRVASAWTSTTTALLVVALLATLQYTVMYGQLARPYAFGSWSVAWMLDVLTRYVAHGKRKHLIAFALTAALSAYAHHFALLFAALVGAAGLFLIRRDQRKAYIVACIGAVVLYLPNLSILKHQIEQGGLSAWLGPPGPYWVQDYTSWIFMYSPALGCLVVALALWGAYCAMKYRWWMDPLPWLALALGLAPILIGYGYSVLRAPVMQYSALIFSFPCLLIALFSGVRSLPRAVVLLAVSALVVSGVMALVFEREHYRTFYSSRHEAYAAAIIHQQPDELVIIDAQGAMVDFYLKQAGVVRGPRSIMLADLGGIPALQTLLDTTTATRVSLGFSPSSPPELPALVQERFPTTAGAEHFCEGSLYRFADANSVAHAEQPVEHPLGIWSDSTVVEYPAISEGMFSSLLASGNDLIEIRAEIPAWAGADVELAADLYDGDKSIVWRGTKASEGFRTPEGSLVLHLAFRAGDYEKRDRDLRLRAYVYNATGRWFGTPSLRVMTRPGNPIVYALYGSFDQKEATD